MALFSLQLPAYCLGTRELHKTSHFVDLHRKRAIASWARGGHIDEAEMLLRLFEFDGRANQETLRSLETMKNPPERAVALIAHIAAN
jgi:hypothetical protein